MIKTHYFRHNNIVNIPCAYLYACSLLVVYQQTHLRFPERHPELLRYFPQLFSDDDPLVLPLRPV